VSLVDPKTGDPDIWLMDLTRGGTQRFTFGPSLNASPVWSPDGTLIVFRTTRNGGFVDLYQKSSAGGGDEDPVLRKDAQLAAGGQAISIFLTDWSSDGRQLLYSATGSYGSELWLLPLLGDRKPANLLRSPSQLMHANFSPDARIVAYTSSESGKYEVWVETAPRSDRKQQISINGGYEPRWRADGRELYYLTEDRKLTAVSVGPGFSFGAPKPLFQTRVPESVRAFRTHYVPSGDGQRFLVNTETVAPAPTQITVVQNWTAGLKK
jgi:dipeptidyl aminopeptidase/acylaminoacyl peptidase